MSSFNRITLVGRLTADPELRFAQSGTAIANFTMAVDRGFNNQQGKKEVDFIRCVAFKQLAEVVSNNLTKGRLILTDGRLQIRNYDDKDGTKRTVAEVAANTVQFLDYPKDAGQQGQYEAGGEDDEDSLPF